MTLYDNIGEATAAAEKDITDTENKIQSIHKQIISLFSELLSYRNYFRAYEYFCVSDENNDSSAYIYVAGDENFSYWTLAGVPCTWIKNPIVPLTNKTLEEILRELPICCNTEKSSNTSSNG